ncbi:unnamed protein product, partial [Aphanomyces euteiches]
MTVVPEANAYRKEKTSTRRTEVGSSNMHSQRAFNDVKNRVFFKILHLHAPEPARRIGGSLHETYQSSAEYRKVPLFSCRSADCFVLCYASNNDVAMQ